MKYVVATAFDSESWDSHGLNWIRHAKSESLNALILGKNLKKSSVDKISELGFTHIPVIEKYNNNADVFYTLVRNLEKDQQCMWIKPSLLPVQGIESKSDLTCGISQVEVQFMTTGVVNLYDRAAMVQSLNESIKKKYNGFLSSEYILGTYDFWNGYAGCQTYLHEKQYLDSSPISDDLVLNFFMAFANLLSCEIKPYPKGKEAA